MTLCLISLQPRQFVGIERNVSVAAGRKLAAFSNQPLDLLPQVMCAQREGKLSRVPALQTHIAEIDTTRLAADSALLDHSNRMTAFSEEIRRPHADETAADDRNVAVDRAHGAVYHRARTTYICGAA